MDFTQSLKIGLQAAQEQIENRSEIQTIFRHLSTQISEYLQFEIKIYPQNHVLFGQHLILTDQASDNILRLAQWSDTDGAYPCSIRYDNEEFICENKQDLELALSNMLQNTNIAEKLLNLKRKIKLQAE